MKVKEKGREREEPSPYNQIKSTKERIHGMLHLPLRQTVALENGPVLSPDTSQTSECSPPVMQQPELTNAAERLPSSPL